MVTISGEWTVGNIIVVALIVVCILALGYTFGKMAAQRRIQNQQATPNDNSNPSFLSRLCGCCGDGCGVVMAAVEELLVEVEGEEEEEVPMVEVEVMEVEVIEEMLVVAIVEVEVEVVVFSAIHQPLIEKLMTIC
ncbi:hypothetical protein NEUTE2DRAFT_125163 [Neurospora tetrasperma FGSC 2509]|nr:hypothetical protein NEUTE2DRAFT_125163 [Neurospora tetrasperma FGSC 2509]